MRLKCSLIGSAKRASQVEIVFLFSQALKFTKGLT